MDESKLQSLIDQIYKLKPAEQNEIIKAIIFYNYDRPLTEKEKQFLEESKKHIAELREIRNQLGKVMERLG